jgi:hypothetical protein
MEICDLDERINSEPDFLGIAEHSETREQFRIYGDLSKPTDSEIQTGFYKHKKGKFYEVIGTAIDPRTREKLVVYKAMHEYENRGIESLWVRPIEMFSGKDETGIPRFRFIE